MGHGFHDTARPWLGYACSTTDLTNCERIAIMQTRARVPVTEAFDQIRLLSWRYHPLRRIDAAQSSMRTFPCLTCLRTTNEQPQRACLLPSTGLTARQIFFAVASGDSRYLREWMTLSDGECDIRDESGRTLLHIACKFGMTDCADILLSAMNDETAHATDKSGMTALQYAWTHGRDGCFLLFCKRGSFRANLNDLLRDDFLQPFGVRHPRPPPDRMSIWLRTGCAKPEQYAREKLGVALVKDDTCMLDEVLWQIPINKQDKTGSTALHLAARHGAGACLRRLLAGRNVRASIEDNAGMTPAWYAMQAEHTYCVSQFLAHPSSDVLRMLHDAFALDRTRYIHMVLKSPYCDLSKEVGKPILHRAIEAGDKALVASLLLRDDCNVNACSEPTWETPCEVAIRIGNRWMFMTLALDPRTSLCLHNADGCTALERFPAEYVATNGMRPDFVEDVVRHIPDTYPAEALDAHKHIPFIGEARSAVGMAERNRTPQPKEKSPAVGWAGAKSGKAIFDSFFPGNDAWRKRRTGSHSVGVPRMQCIHDWPPEHLRNEQGKVDDNQAAQDAEPDAEPEAERDAEPDVEPDAEPDAERDVDRNAERNAGRDAERDAERDTEQDAGQGADPGADRDTDRYAERDIALSSVSNAADDAASGAGAADIPDTVPHAVSDDPRDDK